MASHGIVGTHEDERIAPDDAPESAGVHTAGGPEDRMEGDPKDGCVDDREDTTEDEELLVSCQPPDVLRTYSPKAFALLALRSSESVLRDGADDLLHGDAEDNLEDLASDLDVLSDNIRVYLWNRHKARNPDEEADSATKDEQPARETGT